MKILQINSSARSSGAQSTRLADQISARLQAHHPGASVTRRELALQPVPAIDEAALGALFTPAEQRSPAQAALVAEHDRHIADLLAHDVLVLGVPMYNFGVSVQLKAWLDAVARVGVTFRYTDQGPQGLVQGKTVYLALARGGRYREAGADHQVPFLRQVLGFLGLSDVRCIYAEGLNMGEAAAAQGWAEAQAALETAVRA